MVRRGSIASAKQCKVKENAALSVTYFSYKQREKTPINETPCCKVSNNRARSLTTAWLRTKKGNSRVCGYHIRKLQNYCAPYWEYPPNWFGDGGGREWVLVTVINLQKKVIFMKFNSYLETSPPPLESIRVNTLYTKLGKVYQVESTAPLLLKVAHKKYWQVWVLLVFCGFL